MIPENVIEVLLSIGMSGVNMHDQETVIGVADVMDESAADWLRSNRDLYHQALGEMDARTNGGATE